MTIKKLSVVLCGTLAVAPSLLAQQTPAQRDSIDRAAAAKFMADYSERSGPLLKSQNYLGIMRLLEQLQDSAGSSFGAKSMSHQLIGTFASFVGQYREALEAFALGAPPKRSFDSTSFSALLPDDAVNAVAARAARDSVVFINEAHHIPAHRAFTFALLPRLRAAGYSYLAVETLNDADSALNSRGYPTRSTGFYSNEPVFGEMLRAALRLGFKLVPYESPNRSQEARETGQARNIVDRIIKANPHAKVVVHAGYSHIDETGLLAGAKPMAVRFREMTGIDPLTVDQTVMTDQGDTLYDDPRWRYVVRRFQPRKPVVLRDSNGFWSARPGVHDITVIHPPFEYRDGKPTWLWSMEDRVPYTVPADVCGSAADCVVSARLAGESPDAVPIDIIRVRAGRPRVLALPRGNYVLTARDESGRVLQERSISP